MATEFTIEKNVRRRGRPITHGHSCRGRAGAEVSRTYRSWYSMKHRCLNRDSGHWHRYGGRGITVCDRWLQFENFLADMGERPVGMTLERKNNAGNYEPDNCKWATRNEQAVNKRNNRRITIDGVTKCVAEWAKEAPVGRYTIYNRLDRNWEPKLAVFTRSAREKGGNEQSNSKLRPMA